MPDEIKNDDVKLTPSVKPVVTPTPATPPKPSQDTRPTQPPPESDTTQKPNPTPTVMKPTGGVFVGGPAKAAKPEPQHTDAKAEQPAAPVWNHRGTVTVDNSDDFIYVERIAGNLPFRGVCLKCGWQSSQPSEQDAHNAVHRHLGRHIREAVA